MTAFFGGRNVIAACLLVWHEHAQEGVAWGAYNGTQFGHVGGGGAAQEMVELDERTEAAHGERWGDGNSKLGLVVGVLVVLWEGAVEEGSALFGWVRLNAESIADGENLCVSE